MVYVNGGRGGMGEVDNMWSSGGSCVHVWIGLTCIAWMQVSRGPRATLQYDLFADPDINSSHGHHPVRK